MRSSSPSRAITAVALTCAAIGAGHAWAADDKKTSHEGWPRITGTLWIASNSGEHYDASKRDTLAYKNNELLGSHGNDTITGGYGRDVIWGDHIPYGTTRQSDILNGGGGRDFIYASHGHNLVDGGPRRDIIHALFGRGRIECGDGYDKLHISHKSRPRYVIRHCERIVVR